MVYDRRPMSCRTYFAMENPDNCQHPGRPNQLYAQFNIAHFATHPITDPWFNTPEPILIDHLGVLLNNALNNTKVASGVAMVVISKKAEAAHEKLKDDSQGHVVPQ